ncbi:MAG TPA: SAM-dependent methyltransferase [Candidatus Lokiarchaeia archaeon]|nr:SAM-dependent methyltransferase [Candidatus Lokiarchaeia archaeon]
MLKPGEASSTAEYNALFRAIESHRIPRRRRLVEDPLATCFLGQRALKYYRTARVPLLGHIVTWYIDTKWPGVRPSFLGRTRWIDDQLGNSLRAGIEQVVILGAGYDCRGYHLPGETQPKVFELDHPDTLAAKKDSLSRKLGKLPEQITYVGIDFDTQDIAIVLDDAGFDRSRLTFFLLEGVMHYLTAEAVETTLRSISSMTIPGSRLVFTYIHRGLIDGTVQFGKLGDTPSTLQESGETWNFGLYPEELAGYLAERGFSLVADVSSLEYRARYMGKSGRHMKGFEFYHAAVAEVR